MADAAKKWNKAERLAVAGCVAPSLRQGISETSKRRVARVDSKGNVVGYTTLAEVQMALLAAHKLEIEVADGVRPKEVICERCGLPAKVRPGVVLPRVCDACYAPVCSACGGPTGKRAGSPSKRVLRRNEPPMCKPCRDRSRAKPRPVCIGCGATVNTTLRRRISRGVRCRACAYDALRKETCKNGHPLTGDNVYVSPRGSRDCRTCRREASRRYSKRPTPSNSEERGQ